MAGQSDPIALADLARGRLKAKRAQLEEALVGTVKPHHRFMLTEELVLIDTLDEAIERVNREIEQRLDPPPDPSKREERPTQPVEEGQPEAERARLDQTQHGQALSWKDAVILLDSIPGINRRAAEGILAEIGTDMSRFPTAGHLASWAGMVRCITRLNIPGAARKNSKGGSWVNGLPHTERLWGTGACQ